MFTPAIGGALGIQADPKQGWAIARAAFGVYDVGQFDIALSDASVLNNLFGDPASGLCNVIAPTAGGIVIGVLGVWQQAVGIGQRGRIMVVGETYAYLIKASGNIAAADNLVATTAKNLSPDHAAGDRVIAQSRDALTAPTTRTLSKVFFNGLHGFGQLVS